MRKALSNKQLMEKCMKWIMPLILMTFISTSVVFSEMIVTTEDGRTFRLPISSGDVKKIEYTDKAQSGHPYLGCFKDQGDPVGTAGRDLSGFVMNKPNMTTELCAATCRDRGFAYAGTQYSSWCFCGNSYGKSGTAENCNMKCAGNTNQICGGPWANSVYSIK